MRTDAILKCLADEFRDGDKPILHLALDRAVNDYALAQQLPLRETDAIMARWLAACIRGEARPGDAAPGGVENATRAVIVAARLAESAALWLIDPDKAEMSRALWRAADRLMFDEISSSKRSPIDLDTIRDCLDFALDALIVTNEYASALEQVKKARKTLG